ncbi:MAG TPA: hypothetical protein VGB97_04340 [Candidatus Paceibacterota bacterium]
MRYLALSIAMLVFVPVPAVALNPGSEAVFSLTPEAVHADAGSFNPIKSNTLNGAQGFVWLAGEDVAFRQMCVYLGSTAEPITVTDARAEVYSRGTEFPSGSSNTFVAASQGDDFVVSHVDNPQAFPTAMQPHCFTFANEVQVHAGQAYVFTIDLKSINPHGFYLAGASYRSYGVTNQVYTPAAGNTAFWVGFAIPFELRQGSGTRSGLSNVLFIPGLQGSRLYERVAGIENRRWELTPVLSQHDAQALYLNPDGSSMRAIYTKEGSAIEKVDVPFASFDLYHSFLGKLARLKQEGAMQDFTAFAYDWRMDPQGVVEEGTSYEGGTRFVTDDVVRLAGTSATGKVTIIGHSNGGLVAKALLNRLQREGKEHLVDVVILADVPQLGTPETLLPMLHGDYGALTSYGGIYLNNVNARGLAAHMPDAYALLPSPGYFERVIDSVIDLSGAPSLRTAAGVNAHVASFADFRRFIGGSGRSAPSKTDVETPSVLASSLLARAEETHEALDAWNPPHGVRVVEVAGWGLDTATGIAYTEEPVRKCALFVCRNATKLRHRALMAIDGDGTVVTPSQLAGGNETYVINLPEANRAAGKNWRHADVTESAPFHALFDELMRPTGTLPAFVSHNIPDAPSRSRMRMRVLSPVSLHTYDEAGRHTGPVRLPGQSAEVAYKEEEIPNSYYAEYGEGKYVGLPASGTVRVEMAGLASGTFTYEMESVSESGEVALVVFKDVPVATSTRATVSVVNGRIGDASLQLDMDGDGVVDAQVNASTPMTPLTYLGLVSDALEEMHLACPVKQQLCAKFGNLAYLLQGSVRWYDIDDDYDRADGIPGESRTTRALRKLDKINVWIERQLASGVLEAAEAETLLAMTAQLRTLLTP